MDSVINNYILFWVCIFGLCLGSFYNVVILRSLSDESIIFPPSKCPKCGNRLKPWHNIPVLSYLFLRGKCAFCKEKISLQYPAVEIITMLLFGACFLKFGISWETLLGIILCSSLIIMTATDIKENIVECGIAIALGIIGLIYNWLVQGNILDSIYGLLAGIAILELLAAIGHLLKKGRAFGEADTYVAGALGACFGLMGLLKILIYSLIGSMIFIIPMFIYKEYKNNHKFTCILFISFILSALVCYYLFYNWYTLSAVIITGITTAILFLKNLKQTETLTPLPLIPAFAFGTLYFFFF